MRLMFQVNRNPAQIPSAPGPCGWTCLLGVRVCTTAQGRGARWWLSGAWGAGVHSLEGRVCLASEEWGDRPWEWVFSLEREMGEGAPVKALLAWWGGPTWSKSPQDNLKVSYNSSRPFKSLCAPLGYFLCWDGPLEWWVVARDCVCVICEHGALIVLHLLPALANNPDSSRRRYFIKYSPRM